MTAELQRQKAATMMTMTSRWLLLLAVTQTGHRCCSLAVVVVVPSLAEQRTLYLYDLQRHHYRHTLRSRVSK